MNLFLKNVKKLDANKEKDLVVKYQQDGCIQSRNAVFMSLTASIAKQVIKKVGSFLDNDTIADFIHDNYITALKAIDKYNVSSNARLSTYISTVVSNETKRLLSTNSHKLIKTPVLRTHNSQETQERIKNIHSVSYVEFPDYV